MNKDNLVTSYALEDKTAFLFEKWSELYRWYSEVNLTKEKVVLSQENLWSFWSNQKAERFGA